MTTLFQVKDVIKMKRMAIVIIPVFAFVIGGI